MKIGVADYGMNVWSGGLYDIEERLCELKKLGFNGTERLEALSEADAIHKSALYRRLGMDYSTCRGPNVQANIQWTAALGKDYVWVTPGKTSRDVDFDVFCRRTNELCAAAANYGLKAGIHNHMDQCIETQQELEDFLKACPDATIVFDTGHLSAAGGDPVEIVRKYHHRISVVHLKDVFITDAEALKKREQSYTAGLRFCELGGGNNGLDNAKVIEALIDCGYDNWLHIEHDKHLNEPLEDLKKSIDFIKGVLN